MRTLLVRISAAAGVALALAGCTLGDPSDKTESAPAPSDDALYDSRGFPLSAKSAEAVRSNPDPGLQLLARLQVDPAKLIEFYALGHGILVMEVASDALPPERKTEQTPKGLRADEIWKAHADGAPMPKALVSALAMKSVPVSTESDGLSTYRRSGAPRHADLSMNTHSRGGAASSLRPDASISILAAGGWCSSSSYLNGSGSCGFFQDWQVCWRSVTGNSWARHKDVGAWWSSVCPYRGSLAVKVSSDEAACCGGPVQGSWVVPEDTSRSWNFPDPPATSRRSMTVRPSEATSRRPRMMGITLHSRSTSIRNARQQA